MSIFSIIGLGSILLLLLAVLFVFLNYILSSIAIMKMGQRAGIDESWLAWIPIGNLYIIGRLIKRITFAGKTYEQAEYILPGAFLASTILGRIPLFGSLPSLLMCC